jgi:hypothetical protein
MRSSGAGAHNKINPARPDSFTQAENTSTRADYPQPGDAHRRWQPHMYIYHTDKYKCSKTYKHFNKVDCMHAGKIEALI